MRYFLTGGTGLVGSHVAERLRRAGHEVAALVRASSDARFLTGIGAELVTGDLSEPAERLARGMAGCHGVVHAAALVYRGRTWDEVRAANVAGTERVLRAAALAGAERAVHVSSIAVYGRIGGRSRLSEERWREGEIPRSNLYARSKREAEEAAWRLHEQGAVRLTVARPGVVYGERDRTATAVLARIVGLPVVPLPGGGRSAVPVVYAGNVAAALVAMLERDESVGRAYNLAEDEPISTRAALTVFGRALGRPVRILPVPAAVARGVAAAADAVLPLLPVTPDPVLRRAVGILLRGNPYDSGRARRELGWRAEVSPEAALRRTAAWWTTREVGQGAG